MGPLSIAGQVQIEVQGGSCQNWSVHAPGDQTACLQSGGPEHSDSSRSGLLVECTTPAALRPSECLEF